jgi:muramoyltetrapeptide carboxypeptidase
MAWEKLVKGDMIDIVAPASGMQDICLSERIKLAFGDKGFEVNLPDDLFDPVLFCANTDEYRFNHLVESLTSKYSKAVWYARGGYGSARLIPKLSQIDKPITEKVVIGFSDATAIHLFLSQNWGWNTVHAPVAWQVISEKVKPKNIKILFDLLTIEDYEVKIPIAEQLNKIPFKEITGKLTGGNLSLIQTSIGTNWQLDAKDKIVIIEDIDEVGYRVDRMLEHLFQANIIQNAKAVVFGEFTNVKGEDSNVDEALQRFADKVKFPVFKTEYIGHGQYNYPFVYNAEATISAEGEGYLLEYSL